MTQKIKSGTYNTSRGHRWTVQGMMESSQPNPLNNHQPRAGTKSRECGCQCEMCVGYANKNRIQKKIALKELQDELDNY